MRLSHDDVRLALNFIQRTYAVQSLDDFSTHALKSLSTLVRADWTSYDEMIPSRRISKNLFNPGHIFAPAAWAEHMHEHPMLANYLATNDGRATKVSDFISTSEFERTALYNEVYRPYGVRHEMSAALDLPLPGVVGFAVGRVGRDFRERDRVVLNVVRPHLSAAYRSVLTSARLQTDRTRLTELVDVLPFGVIRLHPNGRVRFANRQAIQWLAAYFEQPALRNAQLPDPLERWTLEMRRRVEGRVDGLPQPPENFVVEHSNGRLIGRLLPNGDEWVVVLEEVPASTQLPRNWTEQFGLTEREATVLRWIVNGRDNKGIAEITGMSPRTVQKHLEHIYMKLGVTTRTEAVAKAMGHFLA